MQYAQITGWGKCVPPAVLSNEDLATFIDTTDEWMNSLSDDDNDLLHNWLLENNYSVHVENDWPDEGIGFSVPDDDEGI